jgi:hypothetical protein
MAGVWLDPDPRKSRELGQETTLPVVVEELESKTAPSGAATIIEL